MAKKDTAANLLGNLMGKASKKKEAPTKKKSTKATITLTDENEVAVFDEFTSSDAVLKVAASKQDSAKNRVKEFLKKRYLELCVERESKPENPKVVTENSSANFIVKHVSRLKLQSEDGTEVSIEEQLSDLGFGEDVIEKVKEKVIKEKQHLGLRRLTDLTGEGSTPEQKAVAEKVMSLIQKHLNDDELALILEHHTEFSVDDTWQNTAIGIAVEQSEGDPDKAVDILERLYSLLSPQFVLSQMVYGGGLDKAFARLADAPVSTEKKVIDSGDQKYRAVVEGNNVSLFDMKAGDEPKFLGVRKCTSPNHAEATAKKWFREPSYLAEALSDFSDK